MRVMISSAKGLWKRPRDRPRRLERAGRVRACSDPHALSARGETALSARLLLPEQRDRLAQLAQQPPHVAVAGRHHRRAHAAPQVHLPQRLLLQYLRVPAALRAASPQTPQPSAPEPPRHLTAANQGHMPQSAQHAIPQSTGIG